MKYKSNILLCLDISYSIVYQVLNINQSISNVTDEGMKGRTKSEAELLRARMERRMMADLMEEQGNSEEEILRRQLRRLKGQDILDLRDIHEQKIQRLRIRLALKTYPDNFVLPTDKESKMPWRRDRHETAGS